ncbi:hypothetical protein [Halopenitus sp. POP-27]|uniref:DNA replication complex subunit Gins51 n=1 Tax=Halopenitus sp. POP-27 TaxID=2994425 RepID=UPI00246843C0|nr:hypothetical protein [Halopenitus sp. POP-27]
MNLDELRSVQAKERRKDSLQHLRDTFYEDVASYIADLRAARDRRAERVDNPFSDDDVRRMSDEVETAEEVAEALYERRIGKVVKLASFAAADMPVEQEGMTTQERELFEDLVARIETNKSAVLDVLTGTGSITDAGATTDPTASADGTDGGPTVESETTKADTAAIDTAGSEPDAGSATRSPPDADMEPAGADRSIPPEGSPTEPTHEGSAEPSNDAPETAPDSGTAPEDAADGGALAEAMGADTADPVNTGTAHATDASATGTSTTTGATQPGDADSDGADDAPELDRTVVRITRDVGEILGVDERAYDLEREDVVTLPVANADPLLERDAAERVE